MVDDTDALARVRSGEARAAARAGRDADQALGEGETDRAEDRRAHLTAKHEPFGEITEAEWEAKYLVRRERENERAEYEWPPAAQFPEGGVDAAGAEPVVLAPDTVVDRFGDAEGRVLATEGTSFAQRSLPPEHAGRDYRRYRVLRPLPVWQNVSAPWFAQPGGGVRYRATYPVAELVAMGYLVELTPRSEFAEAQTVRIGQRPSHIEGALAGPDTGEGPGGPEGQEAQK